MKLSIIIPVFNESKTIEQLIKNVIAQETPGFEKELIVVNDGSTDQTLDVLQKLQSKINFLLVNQANLGKGAAVNAGLNRASGEFILIQDADLEYDPSDYPALLENIQPQSAVFGFRSFKGDWAGYKLYTYGGKFLQIIFNWLYGVRFKDILAGYKLIPTAQLKMLQLKENGFSFDTELACKLVKNKISISEVPIHYHPRTFQQGKKIRAWDGFKVIWLMIKLRVI